RESGEIAQATYGPERTLATVKESGRRDSASPAQTVDRGRSVRPPSARSSRRSLPFVMASHSTCRQAPLAALTLRHNCAISIGARPRPAPSRGGPAQKKSRHDAETPPGTRSATQSGTHLEEDQMQHSLFACAIAITLSACGAEGFSGKSNSPQQEK